MQRYLIMWVHAHLATLLLEGHMATELLECQADVMNTRARSAGLLKEAKVSNSSQKTFTNDATNHQVP